MSFVRAWVLPRFVFWVAWTGWLFCLQWFLLNQLAWLGGPMTLLAVLAPALLFTWIGSRRATNPLDTPRSLFWKGAAASCLLAAFVNLYLMETFGLETELLIPGVLFCGWMALRGSAVKKAELRDGQLFEQVNAIARRSGVHVARVVVFTSARNSPAAFAHRMGAILVSESLLRLLSRGETDAVIAHEAAHLRPHQRLMIAGFFAIPAATVFVRTFWPGALISAPLWPAACLLLWRASRRWQERDADAGAIRATGDPEALITALTRVAHASGIPLHWGRWAGLMLPHPPMTARFRRIARRSGITEERVAELVAGATTVPALPGYPVPPFQADQSKSEILLSYRDRVGNRLQTLSRVSPIALGVLASLGALLWRLPFAGLLVFTAGASLASAALYYAAYELLIGMERRRVRDHVSKSHPGGGFFCGFSPGAEARTFDGMYHYDLGMARLDGGSLIFHGTHCTFSMEASPVRSVWLGRGPRHWTPRRIVCVEYQTDGGQGTAAISFQPLDRWFWPGTSRAAQDLLRRFTEWRELSPCSHHSTMLPPQIEGAVVPPLPAASVWKWAKVHSLISLGISWLIWTPWAMSSGSFLEPFVAPAVTGVLVLFTFAPHLERPRSGPTRRSAAGARESTTVST